MTTLDGIINLNKPTGITSAKALYRVRSITGQRKSGHTGTLDPFASGLLPMGIGEGTKAAPYLNCADKRYSGIIRLGVVTDTLDCTGAVVTTADPPDPATLELETIAAAFRGQLEQVPPAYSAIKQQGIRAYRLARSGKPPQLAARRVTVHDLHLAAAGRDKLRLEVRCSKGTYVRSLARDIGEQAGCGAMLEELVRTAFGSFSLEQAISLDRLREPDGAQIAAAQVIELEQALAHLRALAIDDDGARRLQAGQQAPLAALDAPAATGEKARVLDHRQRLLAVVGEVGERWKLERVFRTS